MKKQRIEFADAKADFAQENFPPTKAINGKRDGNDDGWAISPQNGVDHKQRVLSQGAADIEQATRLTFALDHRFSSNKHVLGRFRISVTDAETPLEFGVPREIDQILAIVREARSDEQQQQLLDWFKTKDTERRPRELALNKSNLPARLTPASSSGRRKSNWRASHSPQIRNSFARSEPSASAKSNSNTPA
ncbi:MAG: hypothetical protein R3B91_10225 [Planctomycetaceae bacterium]